MRIPLLILWLILGLAAQAQEAYSPPIYDIQVPEKVEINSPELKLTAPSAETVTIEESVAIALKNHENVTEAQAAVQQAVARTLQSKSARNPTVTASASYTHPVYFNVAAGDGFGGIPFFTQAPQGTQEQIVIRQLLFDFNRTRSAVKAAEARTIAARAGLEAARQQLAFEVRKAYLELLQSQRLAEVRLYALENQLIHVEQARKLHATGLGLPIDVVRTQTAYANAVQQFTETRNQALIDRVELASFMGIDPRTPFTIDTPNKAEKLPESLDALIELALKQRPGLKQSQAQIEAQKFTLENLKASNKPRISTSLSLSGNQVEPQPQTEQIALMLNLEWPLYDGGLARAQQAEAQAGLKANEAQLSRLQRQVTSDVTNAYIRKRTAEQKISNSEHEVKGAEESVRVASGRYKLGLGGILEVLDAEQALTVARTNQVNARTQLDQALVALEFVLGQNTQSSR